MEVFVSKMMFLQFFIDSLRGSNLENLFLSLHCPATMAWLFCIVGFLKMQWLVPFVKKVGGQFNFVTP